MSAAEALRANRLHDQIQPNVTYLERTSTTQGITVDGHSEELADGLREKGHVVEWVTGESIWLDAGPADIQRIGVHLVRCGSRRKASGRLLEILGSTTQAGASLMLEYDEARHSHLTIIY